MVKRIATASIGIQQGNRVMFTDFIDGGPMWTGEGSRESRHIVRFAERFAEAPTVMVGLSMWDIDHNHTSRADIAAEQVTAEGFHLVFRTWGDTRIARVRAEWTALGPVIDDDHWQLEEVATTHFQERSSEVIKQDRERWDVELTPQLLGTVVLAPDALSITGLWGYIHYLAEQGLNNSQYWLSFWTKVLQPLVTAALVLMAISFIFGPLRSVTLGQRVFTGVLVGFVFRIAQDLLGPSSLVFGFSPLFAVLIPAGICALAGIWLLRRAG